MQTLNIENRKCETPTPAEIRLQIALLASLLTLTFAFIVRFTLGAPLLPELFADFIFSVIPISIVEFGVSLLGPFAKQLGFLGCVVGYLVVLIFTGEYFLRYRSRRQSLGALELTLAASALTLLILFPPLGAGLAGRLTRQGTLASVSWTIAGFALFSMLLILFNNFYTRPVAGTENGSADEGLTEKARNLVISRRQLIKGIGYSVVAVAAYDIARALIQPILERGAGRVKHGTGKFPDIDGLALEVTPASDFYQVSKNPSNPDVDERRWKLTIGGLVESSFDLTYDQIKVLPYVEQYATLECISNEVGGSLISNALWRGVCLKDLLQKAGLKAGIVDIALYATDNYSDSIPLDRAMRDGTILAYQMNGKPLTQDHGFPLRLIVPGIYGMKNVKWITKIEAVNYDYKGYWQRRGWDDKAEYKTMSRIDAPDGTITGSAAIAGIAFAGDRGISKVEVSIDGSKTWELAEIKSALSPFTWVLWHKDWTPAQSGKRELIVRATDGSGMVQTSAQASPIPDGASGLNSITVKVA